MNDREFFAQFDEFSGDVVAKLREALAVAIKDLKSSNSEMALAQMEILRVRANKRLEIDGELYFLGRPEEHIAKVNSTVLAVIDRALDDVKEFVIDSDKAIFGVGEDEFGEFEHDNASNAEDAAWTVEGSRSERAN